MQHKNGRTCPMTDRYLHHCNATPNGLEKCMSFSLDDKLVLIDSFQFLGSSLDSLIKNLAKNDFKNLSQSSDTFRLD